MIEIRKKNAQNIWEHIDTVNSRNIILSKAYARTLDTAFELTELNGSDNIRTTISQIRVYDEVNGGSEESFPDALSLITRLRELSYPYFDDSITVDIDSITVQNNGTPLPTGATTLNFVGAVASGTGQTKTITITAGGDTSEWADYTGAWSGGNGVLELGDINDEGTGTKLVIDDANEQINSTTPFGASQLRINGTSNSVVLSNRALTSDKTVLYPNEAGDAVIAASDWNASTNTPTLANTDTDKNNVERRVSVGGTHDFGAGNITFVAGDIVANNGSIWYKKVNNSGGGSTLEFQTEITDASTVLSIQEGLNNIYPFNLGTAQTATVNNGVYSENDVINLERRGQGSLEAIQGTNVRFRGLRDINNRYFVNDPNSIVSLLCRGNDGTNDVFSIIGNLTKGGSIVTTTSYGNLQEGDVAIDVTVIGTNFSSNMIVSVSANATQTSAFTYINNNEITLHLTAVGSENDTVTVTYDNGDVFVDTDAITIQSTSVIPLANIISGYNFDSNSNDNTDGNNGTDTNITYTTGQVSNAATFNGSSSYIDLADSNNLSFGDGSTDSPFSFTFGVYFDTVGDAYLLAKRQSPNDKEYQVDIISGSLRIILFDQSSGGTLNYGFTHSFVTSTWYHITTTYDGSGSIKIYVDGVEQTLTDNSAGSYTAMENLPSIFRFGAKPFTLLDSLLDGKLDETYIWDKELSQIEVTAIYNEFNSGTPLV